MYIHSILTILLGYKFLEVDFDNTFSIRAKLNYKFLLNIPVHMYMYIVIYREFIVSKSWLKGLVGNACSTLRRKALTLNHVLYLLNALMSL